jgi:hypothetical protein
VIYRAFVFLGEFSSAKTATPIDIFEHLNHEMDSNSPSKQDWEEVGSFESKSAALNAFASDHRNTSSSNSAGQKVSYFECNLHEGCPPRYKIVHNLVKSTFISRVTFSFNPTQFE